MTPTWQTDDGRIQLYCGDCLTILPHIGKVDAVITDPPYGIKMDEGFEGFEGFGGFGKPISRKRYVGGWDNDRPSAETFQAIIGMNIPTFIFGGNFFSDLLPRSTHWLVWDKRQTMPTFGDCELVWTNSIRKSVKIISKEWNGLLGKEESRQHPTQKPVKIVAWIIDGYVARGGDMRGLLHGFRHDRHRLHPHGAQVYRHRNKS